MRDVNNFKHKVFVEQTEPSLNKIKSNKLAGYIKCISGGFILGPFLLNIFILCFGQRTLWHVHQMLSVTTRHVCSGVLQGLGTQKLKANVWALCFQRHRNLQRQRKWQTKKKYPHLLKNTLKWKGRADSMCWAHAQHVHSRLWRESPTCRRRILILEEKVRETQSYRVSFTVPPFATICQGTMAGQLWFVIPLRSREVWAGRRHVRLLLRISEFRCLSPCLTPLHTWLGLACLAWASPVVVGTSSQGPASHQPDQEACFTVVITTPNHPSLVPRSGVFGSPFPTGGAQGDGSFFLPGGLPYE